MKLFHRLKQFVKDTVVVALLSLRNSRNQPVFCYLGVSADNYERFIRDQKSGKIIKPQEYGVVIAAGEGEPPEDVRNFMAEHFGFNHDGPVISVIPGPPSENS